MTTVLNFEIFFSDLTETKSVLVVIPFQRGIDDDDRNSNPDSPDLTVFICYSFRQKLGTVFPFETTPLHH
jgi:hypothetical protein